MNVHQKWMGTGLTIEETLSVAPNELKGDLVGLWHVVSMGRVGFRLNQNDLREFIFLYVFALVSHGAVVMEPATGGAALWQHVNRFGAKPEEVACAVTAEWIRQGEPDISGWEGIAFALPGWLQSSDNHRD